MAEFVPIDLAWLGDHPLPVHPSDIDKDDRGHVLLVGGSLRVPGGLRLTGEAALRAGAGRLQFGLPASLAVALGLLVPEAGVLPLPESADGELAGELTEAVRTSLERCDCLVVGPAMSNVSACEPVVHALLDAAPAGISVVIDAAAIGALSDRAGPGGDLGRDVVLTPNGGEMARLLDIDLQQVSAAPGEAVLAAVERFGATVVLKGSRTIIGTAAGELLDYSGGSIGLATGGSGDVLAGILGGLLSRGMSAREASAWAVWLHGEAGRRLTERVGPVGFLARELLELVPGLIRARQ